MANNDDVIILERLTDETDTTLLEQLLDDAEAFVLAYTNRTHMIRPLEKTVRDLAVIAYNRLGTEGDAGRTEAGERYTFNDAPKQVYDALNLYRLAKVGGKIFERPADET